MDGQIIRLTTPVAAFNKTYSEVTLREPTGALFMRLGEPRIAVVSGESGGWYFVEQPGVINAYLERLVEIEDNDAAVKAVVMAELSLTDATLLKRSLFAFFDAAAAKAAAANSPPKL